MLDVCFINPLPVLQGFPWERHALAWLLEPGWSPALPGEDTGEGLTKWTSRRSVYVSRLLCATGDAQTWDKYDKISHVRQCGGSPCAPRGAPVTPARGCCHRRYPRPAAPAAWQSGRSRCSARRGRPSLPGAGLQQLLERPHIGG